MKYKILNKLDKILTQHGFYTKYTSDDAISVAPAKNELPYCELIQYDAKHINMRLGSDFDDFANSAQDYDDIFTKIGTFLLTLSPKLSVTMPNGI